MALLILVMTVAAYLIGSLSSAIIVSRWLGMDDPRTYGSGNPGASNMLRSGRKDAAAWTLAGDALKGVVAVGIACILRNSFDMGDGIVAWAAIGVVVGHMWPLFFNFQGGKGVATALGVLLAMSFWTVFWVGGLWLYIAFKHKKSSLAALIAAAIAPFVFFIIEPHHSPFGWALIVIAILIWYRHKDNIKRMREGKELLIGEQGKPLDATTPVQETINDAVNHLESAAATAQEETTETAQDTVTEVAETVATLKDKAEDTIETAQEKATKTVKQATDTAEVVAEKAIDSVEEAVEKVVEDKKS